MAERGSKTGRGHCENPGQVVDVGPERRGQEARTPWESGEQKSLS